MWGTSFPMTNGAFAELLLRLQSLLFPVMLTHHTACCNFWRSAGAYKHVFIAETSTESIVYKNFGVNPKFDLKNYERMRKDALATERVSPHPLIVDIYGSCGLAQFDEAMPYGGLQDVAVPGGGRRNIQLHDKDQLDPRNQLRPSEKLQLALEMFESIALLHNHPGGVIVHDDIQLVRPQETVRSLFCCCRID